MSRRPQLLWSVVPDGRAQGSWNRITSAVTGVGPGTILYAVLQDAAGAPLADNLYLGTPDRNAEILCFVPRETAQVRLYAVGPAAVAVRAAAPAFRPFSRLRSALRLLRQAPPAALAGLTRAAGWRPRPLLRELRLLLAATFRAAYSEPRGYDSWVAMFDTWGPDDLPAAGPGTIGYLVLARQAGTPALQATLDSIARQHGGAPHAVALAADGAGVAEAVAALGTGYVGVLQAGEVLPDHATLLAGAQLRRLGEPGIAIADEDDLDPDGRRQAPRFKPVPGHVTMLSGILSRGLWLVRRELLQGHAALSPDRVGWAEALRLGLWLDRYRAGQGGGDARIPFILTHRRPDAEAAPAAVLAELVGQHLARGGPGIVPRPTWPIGFALRDGAAPGGKVTAIVPSTLRAPHSLACIRAVLQGTDYPLLEVEVAVMQPGPLDAVQKAAAASLAGFANAAVATLAAPRFNFSTVNNHVAARTRGEFILLLNDDVSPIRPDWLRWMVAFMDDPKVGAVGARLLYPAGSVQHGGVIMGLSGLCDHAHRFLPGDQPGYMDRAVLAQEMSVVTGACLLVRRTLFERVGGLDEGYPSAFNDVDFALRIGETGHSVVYAAQAELHHHELQTYGSHYAGERSAFQEAEVQRMRRRWAAVTAADPFHNPNLGLVAGREWQPAFPPRVGDEPG